MKEGILAPGLQGADCGTKKGRVECGKSVMGKRRAAQTRIKVKSIGKGEDNRDSRDIQSLIAMSRVAKEPEQAFQARAGRSYGRSLARSIPTPSRRPLVGQPQGTLAWQASQSHLHTSEDAVKWFLIASQVDWRSARLKHGDWVAGTAVDACWPRIGHSSATCCEAHP
jgi:hypothetical protein